MKLYKISNNGSLIDVICAWCNSKIGNKMEDNHSFDTNNKENQITHGICQKCFDKEIAKIQ